MFRSARRASARPRRPWLPALRSLEPENRSGRGNVPFQIVEPRLRGAVRRSAPVTAWGERAAGRDLGAVRHGRTLELAEAEEPVHEHGEPTPDLGQAIGTPPVLREAGRPVAPPR